MLKRKITNSLLEWKNTKNKKCLLLVGARQVGKTFIVREFAKQHYERYIELNFLLNEDHKSIFQGNLTANAIYKQLSLQFYDIEFIPGKTLILLDEIQECGPARTALKSLAEDNRYDVIASSSMLGVAYKQTASIAVGYETTLEMFSLDFEEFLWAKGMLPDRIQTVKEYFDKREQVPEQINNRMLEHMREYMVVGGMPAAVNAFIETSNFAIVHKAQVEILQGYTADIAKYAPTTERIKSRDCYLSIPEQLAKGNKKFQYVLFDKDGKSRKYASSLDWLRDAGLIKMCTNVSTPSFPLVSYKQSNYFKVYGTDIGIIIAMFGFEMKAAIINNTLKGPAKGGIYENLIADILLKKYLPLDYYKSSEGYQEIEFLYTKDESIIPIEVKAGNSASHSLDKFIQQFKPNFAYKFITGNVGQVDAKLTMPLYMAMFL
ncbi:MAG: ATP-binding protein [Christensenellaceae bacterium]|jgi:predicted AAA+ superfamily ATPase|nr:ATP-binding protein [Christensenellaceae bacterium]